MCVGKRGSKLNNSLTEHFIGHMGFGGSTIRRVLTRVGARCMPISINLISRIRCHVREVYIYSVEPLSKDTSEMRTPL